MVKVSALLALVILCAMPALAQDDYPKIQTSMGYANLSFPDFSSPTLANSRHSGFANETSFNLTKNLGLNNYMGIYGLGNSTTLISDFFGGKAMYRAPKVTPYALAGIGFGYFTQSNYSLGSSFATRIGAGVDVPISDSLAWKFEVSRMAFHIQLTGGSWTSGTNFQTGIVFTISQ
jgi:hypothetical protein